ncbi:hypothetical protein VNI00_015413 [Paramarasmius palmivorus]|uniref:Uncharacterized protein n=1 Tax=Paramarasmius palmivorus TaxID=297713 RepID=A0AAW0BKZ0_9AGAR
MRTTFKLLSLFAFVAASAAAPTKEVDVDIANTNQDWWKRKVDVDAANMNQDWWKREVDVDAANRNLDWLRREVDVDAADRKEDWLKREVDVDVANLNQDWWKREVYRRHVAPTLSDISPLLQPSKPNPQLIMATHPHPRLNHVANIHIDIAPVVPGGNTPRGQASWVEGIGGSITSASPSAQPQLHLKVLSGGGDYITSFAEHNVVSLDIRTFAQREVDGKQELFKFQGNGFGHVNDKVAKIFAGDPDATSTEFGEAGININITCNTSSDDFAWMNFAILIGQGRQIVRQGKLVAVEIRVYEMVAK